MTIDPTIGDDSSYIPYAENMVVMMDHCVQDMEDTILLNGESTSHHVIVINNIMSMYKNLESIFEP